MKLLRLALPALLMSVAAVAGPKPHSTSALRGTTPRGAAPTDDISAPARGTNARAIKTAQTTEPSTGSDRVLWDNWYTVTVGKTPYEYYNVRAELKKGRVVLQNHAWKNEEGYINEEQIGSFAEASPELTPLFFNFHSNYRAVETSIDGNMKDGKELTIRIRKSDAELPLIKKMVPKKAFLSEHFPLWLGHRLSSFKPRQSYSFQTIMEDGLERQFSTMYGTVRIENPDELATRTQTVKLRVEINGMRSFWWVEASGAPLRTEMPAQHMVVERTTKEKAQAFLQEP